MNPFNLAVGYFDIVSRQKLCHCLSMLLPCFQLVALLIPLSSICNKVFFHCMKTENKYFSHSCRLEMFDKNGNIRALPWFGHAWGRWGKIYDVAGRDISPTGLQSTAWCVSSVWWTILSTASYAFQDYFLLCYSLLLHSSFNQLLFVVLQSSFSLPYSCASYFYL